MTAPTARGSAMDEFLQSYYELRPVNATFTGVHDYDDRLPDWSPDGLDETMRRMTQSRSWLEDDARRNAHSDERLAQSFLTVQSAEIESHHFHRGNPSLHLGEAIFSVIGLMLRKFAPAETRAVNAVRRLHGWRLMFENAMMSISDQAIHPMWVERSLREVGGARALLRDGLPIWSAEENLHPALVADLQVATRVAGEALEDFSRWLEQRSSRPTEPSCGPGMLDVLLAQGHRIPTKCAELLAEARDALAHARTELYRRANGADTNGLHGVRQRLAQKHPPADRYLATFAELWNDCKAVAEANTLCTWPDYPIRYRRIPRWARTAAPSLYFLFYRSPPPFDDLPTVDYLVPDADDAESLRATNVNVIKQNHVVHHGALGHHVQNYYAYDSASVIGQIAGVDCATRIGMYGAGTMTEGWACYATDLMEEVGFLDEIERVSLQENRVKQLVRALADLELHQGTMTVERVLALFEEQTGMSRGAAVNEVTKISMFPGTGMMYWYGTKRIHELRAERLGTSGEPADLCRFHDDFLTHGSLPVDTIAARMVGERVA